MTRLNRRWNYFFSLLAGGLTVAAFAPFQQSWLVFLCLAWLLWQWRDATPKQALLHGWLFGIGMQAAGVSWIYVSLHYHGATPTPFAVLLILLLSMYLAVYPALGGYIAARLGKQQMPGFNMLLLFPAAWALTEWLQGIVMTGFGWMQVAYTQLDLPLSGYAPLIGGHGIGLLVMLSAGALVMALDRRAYRTARFWKTTGVLVAVIWLCGAGINLVQWTRPVGEPISVALVQGNIAQKDKWRRDMHDSTMALYHDLSVQGEPAALIIWPETAVPDYLHRVSGYLRKLRADIAPSGSDLLLGIFIKNTETGRYFNAVMNLDGDDYRKRHLVPLGEYIPLRFLISFFNRWVDIPMSDIESGSLEQPLLTAAGQPLGVSVCFEDAFSRDVRRDLPAATLLVNLSNDAWFENSHEPHQHHAIARMRALETGRYMLRATNTGISSVIDDRGKVVALAPQFETHVLRARAQPMTGATPYVSWGDTPVLLFSIAALGWGGLRRGREKPPAG